MGDRSVGNQRVPDPTPKEIEFLKRDIREHGFLNQEGVYRPPWKDRSSHPGAFEQDKINPNIPIPTAALFCDLGE